MSEKGPNTFDYLNQIFSKAKTFKYDPKIFSPYLMSLWLSHERDLLYLCNKLNKYQFLLSPELIYDFYYYSVPKGRRFIKWVKKETTKESKKVDELMLKHGISKREAMLYV